MKNIYFLLFILFACSTSNKRREKLEKTNQEIYFERKTNILILYDPSLNSKIEIKNLNEYLKQGLLDISQNYSIRLKIYSLNSIQQQPPFVYFSESLLKNRSDNQLKKDISYLNLNHFPYESTEHLNILESIQHYLYHNLVTKFFYEKAKTFVIVIASRDDSDFEKDMYGKILSDNYQKNINKIIDLKTKYLEKEFRLISLVARGACPPLRPAPRMISSSELIAKKFSNQYQSSVIFNDSLDLCRNDFHNSLDLIFNTLDHVKPGKAILSW